MMMTYWSSCSGWREMSLPHVFLGEQHAARAETPRLAVAGFELRLTSQPDCEQGFWRVMPTRASRRSEGVASQIPRRPISSVRRQ
jgi:hypothetical protein